MNGIQMNNKPIVIIGLLVVIIGWLIYMVSNKDVTVGNPDSRTPINLTWAEKNLILEEMRAFLDSTQKITAGLANDNIALVISSAKKVGRGSQGGVPKTLTEKLSPEFKKLGFDTHSKFDQLALDAESLGDNKYTLQQLSELMINCVACHKTYRLNVVGN